ncbi:MAG TPA: nuclear transport factor 2 family protein [Candidatus Didemnitutus sp.]|nr:nuclear transport factor 2 family protein [Candidatus Didemnitutus sp.]
MKIRNAICSLLFGLMLIPVLAAADKGGAADEAAIAELSRLEQVWNTAHLQGDAAALESLCVDAAVITIPGMKVMTKEEAFGALRSGHIKFAHYETTEVAAHVEGTTATVIGRLRRTRKMGELMTEDDWRFTKVYIRQRDAWRLIAFHASPTGK